MHCDEALQYLEPYLDRELSAELMETVAGHLRACPDCAARAEELRRQCLALDRCLARPLPATVRQSTLRAFRKEAGPPSFTQWWRGLSAPMRTVACALALMGVIAGAGLGGALADRTPASVAAPLDAYIQTSSVMEVLL